MSILLGIGLGVAICALLDSIIHHRKSDVVYYVAILVTITITILKVKGVL